MWPNKLEVPSASAREKARKSIFLSCPCMCSGYLSTPVDGLSISNHRWRFRWPLPYLYKPPPEHYIGITTAASLIFAILAPVMHIKRLSSHGREASMAPPMTPSNILSMCRPRNWLRYAYIYHRTRGLSVGITGPRVDALGLVVSVRRKGWADRDLPPGVRVSSLERHTLPIPLGPST